MTNPTPTHTEMVAMLNDTGDYLDVDVTFEDALGKAIAAAGFAGDWADEMPCEIGYMVTGHFSRRQDMILRGALYEPPSFTDTLATTALQAFPLPQ